MNGAGNVHIDPNYLAISTIQRLTTTDVKVVRASAVPAAVPSLFHSSVPCTPGRLE
jgi:hypothetical protein